MDAQDTSLHHQPLAEPAAEPTGFRYLDVGRVGVTVEPVSVSRSFISLCARQRARGHDPIRRSRALAVGTEAHTSRQFFLQLL